MCQKLLKLQPFKVGTPERSLYKYWENKLQVLTEMVVTFDYRAAQT